MVAIKKNISENSLLIKLAGFVLLFLLLDFCLSLFLLQGLKKYYGLGDNSEIALVGHSHLMLGVDKVEMEKKLNKKVSKYTREGVNVIDRKMMVKQLISLNPQLKTVIYGVDAWTFSSEGLSSNSYKLFYPFMDTKAIDRYVYSQDELGDYLTKRAIRTTRFDELLLSSSLRGYLGNWSNLKYGTVDVATLKRTIAKGDFRKIENTDDNIKAFKETLELLSQQDIQVVLLYVPTLDLMSEAQEGKFQNTIELIEKISVQFDNVEFLNLQDPWSHNYRMFYDPIHLNPDGQARITEELIEFLRKRKPWM